MSLKVSEIPYISHVPKDGRMLVLQPWFDHGERSWHLYLELPSQSNEFIRLQTPGMGSGMYFSEKEAASGDLEVKLATFLVQHLSFDKVLRPFYALIEDIHLISACLDKLELLRTIESKDSVRYSFLVESEIEHLFISLRSMYDLLQKTIKKIGELIQTSDGKNAFRKLPESFADVVLKKQRIRTLEQISKDFQLPSTLANFYFSELERFLSIRSIRNSLAHYGHRLPHVFVTENGFGISAKGDENWSNLEIWKLHLMQPNDIGSVRALAGFLSDSFLRTLDNFESALKKTIHPSLLPLAISEGNRIFLRNPSAFRLTDRNLLIEQPWIPPLSEI